MTPEKEKFKNVDLTAMIKALRPGVVITDILKDGTMVYDPKSYFACDRKKGDEIHLYGDFVVDVKGLVFEKKEG